MHKLQPMLQTHQTKSNKNQTLRSKKNEPVKETLPNSVNKKRKKIQDQHKQTHIDKPFNGSEDHSDHQIQKVKNKNNEKRSIRREPSGRERRGWEEQSQEQVGQEEDDDPRASARCQ